MITERLGWILQHLENEERWKVDEFDIGEWCVPQEPCRTVCCAVGTLHEDERARGAGLTFEENPYGRLTPHYRGYDGLYALVLFFGIEHHDIRYLFYQGAYNRKPTRSEVAKRIRDFIGQEEML